MTFVYLMSNQRALNHDIVTSHVEHLKKLKAQGKLVLCGPFTDYPGGMVVISADNIEDATKIAEADPFIESGYKTYEIRTIELATEENNYLL